MSATAPDVLPERTPDLGKSIEAEVLARVRGPDARRADAESGP